MSASPSTEHRQPDWGARLANDAAFLWPVGVAALLGYLVGVGPWVTRMVGATAAEASWVERLVLTTGRLWLPVSLAGLVLAAAGVALARTEAVREGVRRSGMVGYLAAKLLLFVPWVLVLVLLLLTVTAPLSRALSSVP